MKKGINSMGFWKNGQSGNYLTHKNGITQDTVDFLQSLKVGDRIIVYINTEKRSETDFDSNLKIFSRKEQSNENEGS